MTERDIFLNALERESSAERAAYLDTVCAGRPALRRRVEELLRYHQEDPTFLNVPAMEQLAAAEQSLAFLGARAEPGSLGRLDHYDVFEVVGHGSTGVVLKARDTKLQRLVAVKILASRLAASEAARRRFVGEAQAAAAVRDDNVVAIHAVNDEGPVPYLVMEYISGPTLAQRLERGKALSLPEILRIGMQVATGLTAAHAQGLVHRDIKPANILLENGVQRVKITDFGLARIAAVAAPGQARTLVGTPLYMSPEQAQGEATDYRTDLFSLGSVLYTLCAGVAPFQGETMSEVLDGIRRASPRPLRQLRPEVPDWLAGLIGALLAKDPAARPPSARAVADILGSRLAQLQRPAIGRSPSEGVTSARAGLPPWQAPSSLRVIIALCVIGVLAALAIAASLMWHRLDSSTAPRANDVPLSRLRPLQPLNLRRADIPPLLLALAGGGDAKKAPLQLAAVLGDGRFLLPRVGQTAWMQESPESELLAVPLDEEVVLFDESTGQYLRSLAGPGGRVFHLAFSHDGRSLAATTRFDNGGGMATLWDMPAQQMLWSRRLPGPNAPGAAAFSADGSRLCTAGDGAIYVWDARSGQRMQTCPMPKGAVSALCFRPDGRQVAVAIWHSSAVQVFDWDGAKLAQAHTLHDRGRVGAVAYSPDGKFLVSGDMDECVLRRADSLEEIGAVHAVGQQLAFTPDSQFLFTASTIEMAKPVYAFRRWDVRSRKELPPLDVTVAAEPVRAFHCLSRDGKLLFAAPQYTATYIRVIDTNTGKELYPRHGHFAPLNAVAISPDGRTAASAGEDRAVNLWDLATGRLRYTLNAHAGAVCGLAFSPNGSLLASASRDGTIAVWDATSGRVVRALLGHARSFPRVQFSPDGRTLAGGGENGTVKLWDVASGQERSPLLGHGGGVRCVSFSPDGRRLASGGEDRTVRVHDLLNRAVLKFATPAPVNEVAFSADGRILAAVDNAPDAAIRIWEIESGKETIWHGHAGDVHGLAFSPDGSLIATSCDDGSVRLWDRRASRALAQTIGPGPFGGAVRAVAFTPDGRYLATANANGTVYLLRVTAPAGQL